jgi:hypothetical protein
MWLGPELVAYLGGEERLRACVPEVENHDVGTLTSVGDWTETTNDALDAIEACLGAERFYHGADPSLYPPHPWLERYREYERRQAVVRKAMAAELAARVSGQRPARASAESLILPELGDDAAGAKLVGTPNVLPESIELVEVTGNRAIDVWKRLRERVDATSRHPVVLGPPRELRAFDMRPQPTPPEEVLRAAERVHVESFLSSRAHLLRPRKRGKAAAPLHHFLVPRNALTGRIFPRIVVASVPTRESWAIPAYLDFGDWNDCPKPSEHVAVLRRWHEIYDAEVVCVSHDLLELRVGRPVTAPEDARRVAEEQAAYAPALMELGVGSIDALAQSLLGATVWSFWWN